MQVISEREYEKVQEKRWRGCEDCAGWAFCERSYPVGYDVSKVCKRYVPKEDVLRLPLEVGQCVWYLKGVGKKRKVVMTDVLRLIVKADGLYVKMACDRDREYPERYIGKYIFKSREEAEQARAWNGECIRRA